MQAGQEVELERWVGQAAVENAHLLLLGPRRTQRHEGQASQS